MHPPHPPVTIAVTGIGQRGLQHLHTLWSLQDRGLARIVALCDPYEDNLSEKNPVFRTRIQGESYRHIYPFRPHDGRHTSRRDILLHSARCS